jgi:hypothetical protein
MCRILFLSALLLSPGVTAAEPRPLPFDDPAWEFQGADTRVEELAGETALRLRSGRAVRRDVEFQDGTIEFDMLLTPHRSFVYLQFRIQDDSEYEDLYFRAHKSQLPDAVQYTPVYNRSSNWQIYHGEGHTAAAEFTPGQWQHVRVVAKGNQAAIFVGDAKAPQLVVSPLARGNSKGYIALRGFAPQGIPEGIPIANFANVVVRPGEVPFDFSAVDTTIPEDPGAITRWHVSPSFPPPVAVPRELPAEILQAEGWTTLPTDPAGLLVLFKHRARPEGSRGATALARVTIRAAEATTRRFDFGYSDQVAVYLNGRLLFSSNDSYSFNFPRRQGLLTPDQGSLYLPLQKGPNELVLAVADVFGGWGLLGRFEDLAGLEIKAE